MAEITASERSRILRNTTKGKRDADTYDSNRTARESEATIGAKYFRDKNAQDAEFARRDKIHSGSVKAKNQAAMETYRAKQQGTAPTTKAEAETTRKPLPLSGQAKPESTPVKKAAMVAAASTPRKTSGRPRAKGSVGAASNRDLPGRTRITYKDGSTWDSSKDKGKPPVPGTKQPEKRNIADLRARSKALMEEAKRAGAARSGAAERSRKMNRNK